MTIVILLVIIFCYSANRYFFSWRDPALRGVEEDWLGARNFCRKRCMDSVSVETSNENEWIKKHLEDEKVSAIFLFKTYRSQSRCENHRKILFSIESKPNGSRDLHLFPIKSDVCQKTVFSPKIKAHKKNTQTSRVVN